MTDTITEQPTKQFQDAIAALGIVPPDDIVADGKIHRFSSNGRPNNDAGWYVLYEGDIPHGSFGDFRTGKMVSSWKADIGRSLTEAEESDFKSKQDEARQKREADTLRFRADAQRKAAQIMNITVPASDDHPYLVKKSIKANGIWQWDDTNVSLRHSKKSGKPYLQITSKDGKAQLGIGVNLEGKTAQQICEAWKSILIIPMFDENGLQSLQFISRAGDKKFLYGGKMQGCFYVLGDDGKPADKILIAEGFATAATIHEVTGFPVVVAYNAGNLQPVARLMRSAHPHAEIVLCADDDHKTDGNPGITKATLAAEEVGGHILVPEFGSNRPDKATDFNDMASLEGKDAFTRFFTRHFSEKRAKTELKDAASTANSNDNEDEHEAVLSDVHYPETKLNSAPRPKRHFSTDEMGDVNRIWKNIPRRITYHSENSYQIVNSAKDKIIVTRNRIELSRKAKHRSDAAYNAACEHALQFWNGRMEVHGSSQHKIKAWAFASLHGVEIVNYKPSEAEMAEAQKIIASASGQWSAPVRNQKPNATASKLEA